MKGVKNNDEVLIEWCHELIADGAYGEAESFAKVIYSSKKHPALLMLARAMNANGNSEAAVALLGEKIKKNMGTVGPEMFEVLQLHGKISAEIGDLETSDGSFEYALRALPNNQAFDSVRASTEYQYGSLLAAIGKFQQAQELFNKDLPVSCDNSWKTTSRTVDFFVTSKRHNVEHKDTVSNIIKLDASTKLIYLVSGDLKYCENFGPRLLKSLNSFANAEIHLHFHGTSIGDKDLGAKEEAWDGFKKQLGKYSNSTSFSRNHIDKNDFNESQIKAIYSFERFRVLPNILKQHKIPVLVADIDQLPLRSPIGLLTDKFDVALLRFPKGVLNILSVISATLSFFRPTENGIAAADTLQSYFESALSNTAKLNWHVDQAGLAVLDYQNTDAHIKHLDSKLVVTDPSKHDPDEATKLGAWFWSVTNSIAGNAKKLDDYEREKLS